MYRLALACTAAALAVASSADAAQRKEPPKCAAVSFRPLVNIANDGTMTAGHYRSRFGTMDLIATVAGGQDSYRLQINNKDLVALQGEIPKASYPCLNSRNIKTPPQLVEGACRGSRFRAVADSSTKDKLYMLFALQGDDWKLCQAGRPPG